MTANMNINPDATGIALTRLKELLESELLDLENGNLEAIAEKAKQKLQLLAQLSRIARTRHTQGQGEVHREQLEELQTLIETNMKRLKVRMNAVSEVVETIETAARDADSDGTYLPGQRVAGEAF